MMNDEGRLTEFKKEEEDRRRMRRSSCLGERDTGGGEDRLRTYDSDLAKP
jgi:hypothetical protein